MSPYLNPALSGVPALFAIILLGALIFLMNFKVSQYRICKTIPREVQFIRVSLNLKIENNEKKKKNL